MGRSIPVPTGSAANDGDGISRPYKDIWRSERLVYRAVGENPEDKMLYRAVMSDPVSVAQGMGALMRPQKSEENDANLVTFSKALLAVSSMAPVHSFQLWIGNSIRKANTYPPT